MKILSGAVLLLTMVGVVWAVEPTAVTTEDTPLVEKTLTAIKASISLPDGWFVKEEAEDGIFVYYLTREKMKGEGGTYVTGLTLTVTTKVPERAEMSASKYGAELVEAMADGLNPAVKSEQGPLKISRISYAIEGEKGSIDITNYAEANDKTGTLYFISWQTPAEESEKLVPLREKILSSLKVDPAF